jgi:predicted Fe-Mo cluster-binding NifX family protein
MSETMRIAVSAKEPRLDAQVDPAFGRCPYLLVVETDDLSFQTIDTSSRGHGQGAGIETARQVADHGAQCVLTGNCGPNAHQTLTAAGIDVITDCDGTIRDVIEQFKAGQLTAAKQPGAPGRTDTADETGRITPSRGGRGGGRGWGGGGRGGGRGMGGGRRAGRGRGEGGGGRGRGRKAGR